MVKIEDRKMISIIDIINAIADKLSIVFGDIEIYTEEIEQGMKEPCFFITVLNIGTEKGLNSTYTDSILFDVQYLNELNSRSKNEDFIEIRSKLHREVEYIELEDGKIIRLNNRKTEKVNDILHYFFDVDIRFIKIAFIPKMNQLDKKEVVIDE
jgi:uncharacterized membrane protein